ncbi:lipopolysaccharide assembly protein LapB [Polaromonas sp. C04]|uniref:lipopolysaccharide assembly protein LapB n=1 Tax=Polaromonas sp. C04 TaxID=1945857 RepID=UPI0009844130|nr:lipopolysaccharide assembly protein LapB [Polaromonas sp. C04]OOG58960.1 lipopolysaccharide assembly protein LapB [Polaromonas sp. C04]
MDFDLSWILLGLPVAFILGWAASRFDLRQLRMENRQAPKAYFKGLNFLLNEQQDQAIDAFIEAVQNDPDTSELHFALGNLFRRRGEYERAVRVHEHLLSRGDLSRADRERAQHALALDFLKAGLLDRAEEALRKLEGTPFETQASLALLAIFERSRDWPQAARIAQKLEDAGQGSFSARQAHYLCEQAAAQTAEGNNAAAHRLLDQALTTAPHAPRPRIDLAALHLRLGEAGAAFESLQALLEVAPLSLPLVAHALCEAAMACGRSAQALSLLKTSYVQDPSLDVLDAIVTLTAAAGEPAQEVQGGRDWYLKHLEREPSLVAAAKWIAGEKLEHEQFHPQVQRALDHAARPLMRYRCAACGFEATQHFWQCPGCQAWDSYPARRVEEL